MNEPTGTTGGTISAATAGDTAATDESSSAHGPELIEDELLVEEISIDGMCGVY